MKNRRIAVKTNEITIYAAAEIFKAHAKDIMRLARKAPHGFRVLAEIDGDGAWKGAGIVTQGTGSLLAHECRGFAAYFGGGPFTSLAEIEEQILGWLECSEVAQ